MPQVGKCLVILCRCPAGTANIAHMAIPILKNIYWDRVKSFCQQEQDAEGACIASWVARAILAQRFQALVAAAALNLMFGKPLPVHICDTGPSHTMIRSAFYVGVLAQVRHQF